MKTAASCALLLILILFAPGGWAASQPQPDEHREKTLTVAVFFAPPFSMKNANGEWDGISVALWRAITADLNIKTEFKEMELASAIKSVENGLMDAALPALTITSERETYLDFTHPYFVTGLTIAVRKEKKARWSEILGRILSPTLLTIVSLLLLHVFVVGALVWLLERKRNPKQFGGKPHQGIASGFWWSAVTMTSVGYGDKTPMTFGGRLVAVVWMFISVVMVASFTAHITTTLTVTNLTPAIHGPEDLTNVRVATVDGSTSEIYLQEHFIVYKTYENTMEALQALADDDVQAVVYEAPLLRYLVTHQMAGKVRVLPLEFETQYFGFALQEGSPLRNPINISLLRFIQEPSWRDILRRYLGKAGHTY